MAQPELQARSASDICTFGAGLHCGAVEQGFVDVSSFRIKFTLHGGIGLFTSPPFDSLELALQRAADLERRNRATIERIVGVEGFFVLDRDGCARLLRARQP
jgi:hypothetical protein